MYYNRQNRGEIRNLWSMTKKKVVKNFGRWKWETFEIFQKVWKFLENRGNLKQGGKCIMASGGDGRPWSYAESRLWRTSDVNGGFGDRRVFMSLASVFSYWTVPKITLLVQQNFGISNISNFGILNFRFYWTTVNGPATINASMYMAYFEPWAYRAVNTGPVLWGSI